MALIYADDGGNIIRFLQTEEEEKRYPDAPAGTVTTIEFDPKTNASLITGLNTNWNSYSVSGTVAGSGVVLQNGTPVVLAPKGLAFRDRENLRTIWQSLKADGTITAAELRVILRYILRRILADDN
jgi:hypothetical protein